MDNKNKKISPAVCNLPIDSIFRFLSQQELERMLLARKCFTFPKGKVIYLRGCRTYGFYCLNRGIVKLTQEGVDGKEQIIKLVNPGEIFGYQCLLKNTPPELTAKTLEKTDVCYIPSEVLFDLIKDNNKFAVEIIKITCLELEYLQNSIIEIAHKTVKQRLAEKLVNFDRIFGCDTEGYLNIKLSREEYANLVGTATETVIRLFSEFKNNKLIELNKQRIRIMNYKMLNRIKNPVY